MRRPGLVLLLLALVLASGFGCYTMIRHPESSDFVEGEPADQSCIDCHSDSQYSQWTDPYYTSFYGHTPGSWGAYYAHPWWYDQNWYASPGSGDKTTGGRNAWDRGPGAPSSPYLPPVGAGSVSAGGGSGRASVTPADSSHTARPDQEPTKEQPKKAEPKRNAWSR
jgi:hypothetical protein